MDQNIQQQKEAGATPQNISRSGINLSDIVCITRANFRSIRPEWLGDENLLLKIKVYIFDIIDGNELSDTMECFDLLSKTLKQASRLVFDRPDIFREYLRLLAILKATFLSDLPEPDIETFFRESLIYCFEVVDFDLAEKIFRLIDLHRRFPKEFEEQRKQIQTAIEANKEFLGMDGIVLEDKTGEQYPIIVNWLSDYNQFCISYIPPAGSSSVIRRTSGGFGGSLQRVAYMQKNANARKLSRDEKIILFKLLELYDWLRTLKPNSFYEPIFLDYTQLVQSKFLEDQSAGTELEYVVKERLRLPEEVSKEAGADSARQETARAQPLVLPVVPVKPQAPENIQVPSEPSLPKPPLFEAKPKDLSFRAKDQTPLASRGEDKISGIPTASEKTQEPIAARPISPTPINLQDILNRRQTEEEGHSGLKLGDGNQVAPLRPVLRDASEDRQGFGGQASSKYQASSIKNQETNKTITPSLNKIEKPRVDIDKKLEELKKKINK